MIETIQIGDIENIENIDSLPKNLIKRKKNNNFYFCEIIKN